MIHTLTIDVTTHCNRRCENCCAGVGINRILQHHPYEYFERAAKLFYGIERVNMTGGEPTMHPRFEFLADNFKSLFGCRTLTLSTNGYRLSFVAEAIRENFDQVDFSDYGDNHDALNFLTRLVRKVNVFPAGEHAEKFTPRSKRGTGSCFRRCAESGTVAYADGKVFGCCVAPGIDTASGVELKGDWRETIESAPLPCDRCMFAGE